MEHILRFERKNPEYKINGILADAKRIQSEKGITNGFSKAKKQGCGIVVIDLDKSMNGKFNSQELASRICMRKSDFNDKSILECYIVANEKAIVITESHINNKDAIISMLNSIKKP